MENQIAALLMRDVPPPAEPTAPTPQVAVTDEAITTIEKQLSKPAK